MQNKSGKISIREKICYGLGDSSANIFFGMTMMFLPYFYTDVVGLTAGAMGTLFLIARLVDAFSDPFIGNFADRHKTKYGHYRPFLLYLAIPYGLSCFLVFLAPSLPYTGKLIYAFVTYIFLILMYAGTVVPYVGLLSVLTDNPSERLSINSYRFPLAKSAFLLCSAVVPMFVASYDKANEAQAYSHAMIIIGILAVCWPASLARRNAANRSSSKMSMTLLSRRSRSLPRLEHCAASTFSLPLHRPLSHLKAVLSSTTQNITLARTMLTSHSFFQPSQLLASWHRLFPCGSSAKKSSINLPC